MLFPFEKCHQRRTVFRKRACTLREVERIKMAITKYSEKTRFCLDSSNYGISLPDVRMIRRESAFTPQGKTHPSAETI